MAPDEAASTEEAQLEQQLAEARAAATAAAAAAAAANVDGDGESTSSATAPATGTNGGPAQQAPAAAAAEIAALLCDLADLKLARGAVEEGQTLLQEAFALRRGDMEAAAAPAGCSGGAAASSSGNGDGDAWDASDDWEPDVSGLKAAAEFAESSGGGGGALSGSSGPDGPGGWRSGGGGGGAGGDTWRVRGRGTRKAPVGGGADEEDDWNAAKAAAAPARDLPHVVEIFGLTRAVTTSDLETFLLDYMWGALAPSLRWVDDNHALAVFPCAEAADVLLSSGQREYAVRPYRLASAMSHEQPPEALAPPRVARPKTTTAVARRLIGQALGVSAAVRDRQAEAELAALRREKREERRQRQQQQAAAWEDD